MNTTRPVRPVFGMLLVAGLVLMFVGLRDLQSADTDPAAFRQAAVAVQTEARALGDATPAYYEALETGFRRLQKQYPTEDEVYSELLFVADRRPTKPAIQLAQQVIEWPSSPGVKDKARGVIWKKEAVGKPLDLKLTSIKGDEINLASLKGKVVLVDFWATWCPSCQEKLGELKSLYGRFQSRGLEIVGISFDEKPRRLGIFLDVEGVTWPQHCSGEGWSGPGAKLAARFGLTSLPGLWLVDRKGNLRDLDARENLAGKVEALLAEKP